MIHLCCKGRLADANPTSCRDGDLRKQVISATLGDALRQSWKNQRAKLFFDLFEDFGRQCVEMLSIPSTPINTLDMVGKDGSLDLASLGHLDFKRITLCPHCNRNDESESYNPVIVVCRQDKRWSPPALLVTFHGIEVHRDYITAPRDKILVAHHTSSPAGLPQ